MIKTKKTILEHISKGDINPNQWDESVVDREVVSEALKKDYRTFRSFPVKYTGMPDVIVEMLKEANTQGHGQKYGGAAGFMYNPFAQLDSMPHDMRVELGEYVMEFFQKKIA